MEIISLGAHGLYKIGKNDIPKSENTTGLMAVPDLVRYVFKATNLGKQDLGVPQLLRKRYSCNLKGLN